MVNISPRKILLTRKDRQNEEKETDAYGNRGCQTLFRSTLLALLVCTSVRQYTCSPFPPPPFVVPVLVETSPVTEIPYCAPKPVNGSIDVITFSSFAQVKGQGPKERGFWGVMRSQVGCPALIARGNPFHDGTQRDHRYALDKQPGVNGQVLTIPRES